MIRAILTTNLISTIAQVTAGVTHSVGSLTNVRRVFTESARKVSFQSQRGTVRAVLQFRR